jgi:hypothetical protein
VTTDNAAPAAEVVRSPTTEKRFAIAEVAAPMLTAAVMPFLDPQTAGTMSCFLAAPALIAGVASSGLIPEDKLHLLPGGDIMHAHRRPFLVSAITTGVAAATVTLNGTAGIDALTAGWMTMPSINGLVSLAWWAAVGFVGYSLRRVLSSKRHAVRQPEQQAQPAPQTPSNDVLLRWHQYISGENGAHPGQHLHLTAHGPDAWEGILEADPGRSVDVTRETVSGVYRIPVDWVRITDGPHTSSKHILVHTTRPAVDQPQYSALEALWLQRVAAKSGCMPGTHLNGIVPDPATGGVAAWIVADEDTDLVTMPDPARIAGALRTTTLLVAVEKTSNPRKAKLRIMDRSPLEDGTPLPGPEALRANKNGFVNLGTGISGRPARVQVLDEHGGARHVLIAGVTGSGKGGVLQLLALAYHVNGVAMIYADPKGSSNPDVEDMAAYAGCGPERAMGALRVAYAELRDRINESARLRQKNFKPTPERPWLAVILDEMAQLLGEKSIYQAEAAFIVAAIAEQGRSLGMALVLCGQILNLDKMGGDTSIRDNVFYGGALILLRSDGAQKNRVDLPDSFEGVDPSKIPAFWSNDDETLIYDPDMPEDDPRRTFGVGYVVGPDERAEMMRAWILESAEGMFDPDAIVIPGSTAWYLRDEIALISLLDDGTDDDEDGEGASGKGWKPGPARAATAKEPTAEEKILIALDGYADPLGEDPVYLHLDQLTEMTGVTRKIVENTCSRMTRESKLVRNPDTAGEYGLPLPAMADA